MSPPHSTLAVQKPPIGSPEPVRAPGPLDPSTLPDSEPGGAGLQRVRAMLNTAWPAFSFLLIADLSRALFDGVLGALQTLTHAAGCYPLRVTHRVCESRPPAMRDASFPHSITHHEPPFLAPRSPVSLGGLTDQRKWGCRWSQSMQFGMLTRARSAALFLAGTLCLSWFTVLEVFQRTTSLRRAVPLRLAQRVLVTGATLGMIQYTRLSLVNVGLPARSKSIHVRQGGFV